MANIRWRDLLSLLSQANHGAFAAILGDGSALAWGNARDGGDPAALGLGCSVAYFIAYLASGLRHYHH